jgi:hypothetical protein
MAKMMLRAGLVVAAATGMSLAAALPASATIHEQVAAYCSGGGHGAIGADGFLEPPGISDPTKGNFAQPVLSDGVVVIGPTGPVITNRPPAKYPAGTNPLTLTVSQADHPSAQHCRALNP